MSENETRCPKCGAELRRRRSGRTGFACGSSLSSDSSQFFDSEQCLRRQNEQLRTRLAALVELAEPFIRNNMTVRPEGHICNPENQCDCICVEAAQDAELLRRLLRAKEALK